jgi:hypothetical protein
MVVEEAGEFEIIPGFEDAEEKSQDLLGYDASFPESVYPEITFV